MKRYLLITALFVGCNQPKPIVITNCPIDVEKTLSSQRRAQEKLVSECNRLYAVVAAKNDTIRQLRKKRVDVITVNQSGGQAATQINNFNY